jgi:hypothetical protein
LLIANIYISVNPNHQQQLTNAREMWGQIKPNNIYPNCAGTSVPRMRQLTL